MLSSEKLGRWAVIDLETTGIDPGRDAIIDVGFLQFEGTKLVRKFQSLVRTDIELSHFIQKLTGINNKMLSRAPKWSEVEADVLELEGHTLLAHNADFEKSFLNIKVEKISKREDFWNFADTLFFLPLIFPETGSFKLENFIVDWELREGGEVHRGFEDSLDLLKVMIMAKEILEMDREKKHELIVLLRKYQLDNHFFYHFLNLDSADIQEIAEQIEFDLDSSLANYKAKRKEKLKDREVEELHPNILVEFSGENIKNFFSDEEKLQKVVPQFKYRPSQEELALRTGQAFKNNVHALVQAPTGTGKTLGYMIPSALFALENQKQVLISTGTKTLQYQAMYKDVPQLRKLLGLDESKLVIKRLVGSSNHLCELMFRNTAKDQDLLFVSSTVDQKFAEVFWEMTFYHNAHSSSEDAILRDDLPYIYKMKIKGFKEREKEVAVDFRACTGSRCPFASDCTYIRGLREAKDANLIIGNHALMYSWPRGFARPQYIVVDEAHRLEEETTRAFTLEASQSDIEGFARSLSTMQGPGALFYMMSQSDPDTATEKINHLRSRSLEAHQMMMDHLLPMGDLFEIFFKKSNRFSDEFWNELPMVDPDRPIDELGRAIFNHLDSLRFILGNYYNDLLPSITLYQDKTLNDEKEITAFTRFESFVGTLEDLITALDSALKKKDKMTNSLFYHSTQGYAIRSQPIDVGQMAHDQLLATTQSVVFTSATLANASGDQGSKGMEWVTGYTYLDPSRRFKSGFFLPPVYDYLNNTKVYLCDNTPSLHSPDYIPSVLKELIPLIKRLHGRSLLLFSSRKRFEMAVELLLSAFEGQIPVFVQGMGNKVVDEFKNCGDGVLVGMESFGEGIDIPGDALQFVFVDKIPDLRQELVIDQRRAFYDRELGNEFADYYLAHRARALQQKLGRLIRTETDYGGIIVADSRVRNWKGGTMNKLVKLMEPYKLLRADLSVACDDVAFYIETRREKSEPSLFV